MDKYIRVLPVLFYLITFSSMGFAQDRTQTGNERTDETQVPERVDVQPEADDSAIQERLSGILDATGWFSDTVVEVNDGVVFLRGSTEAEEYKRWAGDLARNTQDVAAVVNQVKVVEPDIWDYEPAFTGMQELWQSVMRAIPFWVFGLTVLFVFWGVSLLVAKATRSYLKKREMNLLLQDIAARGVAVVVFLLGLYIVFHIADLTQVALTVLGGTGLLGIILGIAFRDITENFLASIFLSVQNPFHAGDLVEINGNTGFIQRLTIRATLLMTLEGNHMQIPNSTVYKSSILNFTSNPNQREQFVVGIGYDDSITSAQEVGAQILSNHPAVLKEPEPWILVNELASSTINLKFYFWVNGDKHNLLKVRSSVMRQVKSAYIKEGISMPDEAREMVFPKDVPVLIKETPKQVKKEDKKEGLDTTRSDSEISTQAEGKLESNDNEILEQARRSRSPEEGDDLLKK